MKMPGILRPVECAPAVSVRGVDKIYSAGRNVVTALDGIDLDFAAGEVAAVMGPSGSGKTTLLSIIGCILRPSGGSVSICGKEVSGLGETERSRIRLAHIGFIFQGYNLFPGLTARQNIEVALDLRGSRGRSRREMAESLLEKVELGEKADSFPADLSGGQKQRVAIARALAGTPDLILADEPTAALDYRTGRRIMMLFRDLAHERDRAVIIVTHDMRMLDFTDRVVSIDDGRIVSDEIRFAGNGRAMVSPAVIGG
jgi:putative ABC transport system ATP-binding protein